MQRNCTRWPWQLFLSIKQGGEAEGGGGGGRGGGGGGGGGGYQNYNSSVAMQESCTVGQRDCFFPVNKV